MISWLYRYVFRGWSIVLIAGIITFLWLDWQEVHSQAEHSAKHPVTAPQAARPRSAER
jgi:hypothetical protein